MQVYSTRATKLDEQSQRLLERLAIIRNKEGYPKEDIDNLRGILMTLLLWPEKEDENSVLDLTNENFDKLLKYLSAIGDFAQEVKKIKLWKEFLEIISQEEFSDFTQKTIEFASFFKTSSQETLGKYTSQLDKFISLNNQEHLWKEDIMFFNRKEVEYHLNMVGAEIMNKSLKNEFDNRPRKALLLPGCMRLSEENCKAKQTNLGLKCMSCLKQCNVKELTGIGYDYGFEVYIVSHESSAFSKATKKDRDELGIIGVACVSNLIAGGWKSKSLNIPAQCVLLNKSSCKNHWHKTGIPTNINLNQLYKLFSIHEVTKYKKPQICGYNET